MVCLNVFVRYCVVVYEFNVVFVCVCVRVSMCLCVLFVACCAMLYGLPSMLVVLCPCACLNMCKFCV